MRYQFRIKLLKGSWRQRGVLVLRSDTFEEGKKAGSNRLPAQPFLDNGYVGSLRAFLAALHVKLYSLTFGQGFEA